MYQIMAREIGTKVWQNAAPGQVVSREEAEATVALLSGLERSESSKAWEWAVMVQTEILGQTVSLPAEH